MSAEQANAHASQLARPLAAWSAVVGRGNVLDQHADRRFSPGAVRAALFTHELTHLRKGAVPGFRVAWHLLVGMPLAIPHFLYRGIHNLHHDTHEYGTSEDAEYIGFAESRSRLPIVGLMAATVLFPVMAVFRLLALAPISLVHSQLRGFVMREVSSLGVRVRYKRRLPSGRELTWWKLEEFSASAFFCCLLIALLSGALPWSLVPIGYTVLWLLFFLNAIRAIGATHRYLGDGSEMTLAGQVRDSVNIAGHPISSMLIAPLGLRWHALHHLFPGIPYHNLSRAHQILINSISPQSLYGETVFESVWAGFRQVWNDGTLHKRLSKPEGG